jgi:hypothetical protein
MMGGRVLSDFEASIDGSRGIGVGRPATLPVEDMVDSCRVRAGTLGDILVSRCGRDVK